jgi:hypothetical protein
LATKFLTGIVREPQCSEQLPHFAKTWATTKLVDEQIHLCAYFHQTIIRVSGGTDYAAFQFPRISRLNGT